MDKTSIKRELQVVKRIKAGDSLKKIKADLKMGTETITRISKKYGVRSRYKFGGNTLRTETYEFKQKTNWLDPLFFLIKLFINLSVLVTTMWIIITMGSLTFAIIGIQNIVVYFVTSTGFFFLVMWTLLRIFRTDFSYWLFRLAEIIVKGFKKNVDDY